MAEIPSYPIAVMAKLLDLSERHVRRLADEKVLKKPERNKGWEITNVTLYIRYLTRESLWKIFGWNRSPQRKAQTNKGSGRQGHS